MRLLIDQSRLLTLSAAHAVDTVGNRAARQQVGSRGGGHRGSAVNRRTPERSLPVYRSHLHVKLCPLPVSLSNLLPLSPSPSHSLPVSLSPRLPLPPPSPSEVNPNPN